MVIHVHFNKRATPSGWIFRVSIVLCLVLSGVSCSSAKNLASSTSISAVVACDTSKITVTGVHWFREASGAWRVVGVINNRSSRVVSKVVTGVETPTNAGQPADQGEDVSACPLNLQARAQALIKQGQFH